MGLMNILLALLGWQAFGEVSKRGADWMLGNPDVEMQKLSLGKQLESEKSSREAATTLRRATLEQARQKAMADIQAQAVGAKTENALELTSNPNATRALAGSLSLLDVLGVNR